jgi:carbamoyl-phosphate synthase small subunit
VSSRTPAILVLKDGTVFRGSAIGAEGFVAGEVVFNTAMTGYQEILTDPSYCRQIVTLTYPHIGNTGANPEDVESEKVQAAGLVIRDLPLLSSNFRETETLGAYLKRENIVAIAGIDTRKLTRILRDKGAQDGCIMAGKIDEAAALKAAREFPGLVGMDLAKVVSCKIPYATDESVWALGAGYGRRENGSFHVVAYDFGVKRNILRMLAARGCRLTVVPVQRSRRSRALRLRDPRHPRAARHRCAAVRHLPRPPVAGAGLRRKNAENEVRPPWRQSPGAGPRVEACDDHQPEPRFRGGCGDAAGQCESDPCFPVRRQPAGFRAD